VPVAAQAPLCIPSSSQPAPPPQPIEKTSWSTRYARSPHPTPPGYGRDCCGGGGSTSCPCRSAPPARQCVGSRAQKVLRSTRSSPPRHARQRPVPQASLYTRSGLNTARTLSASSPLRRPRHRVRSPTSSSIPADVLTPHRESDQHRTTRGGVTSAVCRRRSDPRSERRQTFHNSRPLRRCRGMATVRAGEPAI